MIKFLIKKIDYDKDKNNRSHFALKRFCTIGYNNKSFSYNTIKKDLNNPNWLINFMILIDKKLLFSYFIIILLKINLKFYLFKYIKNL